MACLPDNSPAMLALFRNHAFAFVTDTRVSWDFDESSATVTTDFQVETEVKEGSETHPLLELYRHQWLHANASFLDFSFDSLHGEMKVIDVSLFSTTMTYPGIMPLLPAWVEENPGYDSVRMNSYLDDFLNQSYGQLFYRGDTYFGGKDLGIVSSAIRVADMVGRTDVRDYLLIGLKDKLEDWLAASPGEEQTLFYYNSTWGTMYGIPTSFGTSRQLNGHHFHWGYFIMAASVVAMYDPEWAQEENWGGMVNLLIRDADSWDREDEMFPFLRCFDPLCRSFVGIGARRFRGRQQPGVLFRGDAVRRRGGPVGFGDRKRHRP
jgi:endoglucanase Acf2